MEKHLRLGKHYLHAGWSCTRSGRLTSLTLLPCAGGTSKHPTTATKHRSFMLTGPGEPARPDTWKRDITSGNVSGHTIASTLGPLALSSLPDTGMAPRFPGLLNPLAKCCFPSPRSPALHCPPGAPGRGASGGAAAAAGGQEILRQGPAQTPAWRRTALQQLPPARAQRELCVQSLGALIRRPRPGPTAPRAPGASRRSPNAQSANLQAPPQQRRTHLAPPPPGFYWLPEQPLSPVSLSPW